MQQGISLKMSCRRGKVMAGYLYLPRRANDRAARSRITESGLVIDYASDGRPIGVEIPNPTPKSLEALIELMRKLDCPNPELELGPLRELTC